jgi:hypothetical protein
MLTHFSTGINELQEANAEAVFELVGYVMRRGESSPSASPAPERSNTLNIGSKQYKRISADDADWLR